MLWQVYSGAWVNIASDGDVMPGLKYSVSINLSTGLYYRLHIPNVGVSDEKKYRCERNHNGMIQRFYIDLNLLGRCRKSCKVIFKVENRDVIVVDNKLYNLPN